MIVSKQAVAPLCMLGHANFLVVVEHGMKVRYLGIDNMEQGNWKSRNQERPGKRQCWNPSCLAKCDEEPARCLHSGTARILGLFQQCQNSSLATQIHVHPEAFWNI